MKKVHPSAASGIVNVNVAPPTSLFLPVMVPQWASTMFFDMNRPRPLDPESQLKKDIDKAMDELKINPLIGNKIEKDLWPEEYVKTHKINNLFRYPLRDGYRLTYTLVSDKKYTTSIILDALDHGEYDELFGYDTS